MSLYVCLTCTATENDSCMRSPKIKDPKFPNLSLMEMFTKCEHVASMLCSKCNTDERYEGFPEKFATPTELEIASFSKYNYITPFDHCVGLLIHDDKEPNGYVLSEVFMRMCKDLEESDIEFDKREDIPKLHPLYYIWQEDRDNFDTRALLDLDINNARNIELSIMDSQKYPKKSKSAIFKRVKRYHNNYKPSLEKLMETYLMNNAYIDFKLLYGEYLDRK